MPTENEGDYLTPREYARKRGIRLDTVYSKVWSGKLPAIKKDGRWLIPAEVVETTNEATDGTSGR
jgi:excisionase family DNA binding protein